MSRLDYTQAGLLAHFGELVHPEPRPLGEDVIQKLKDLRTRRDDLQHMVLLEKDRLDAATGVLRKDVLRHIDFLEQSISTLTLEFSRTVRFSSAWR
jgi:transposase